MGKISITVKLNIVIIGIIASLLFFFMAEVLLAEFFLNFVIDNYEDRIVLSSLILSLFLLSFVTSIIIGILVADRINRIIILKASIMAFVSTLIVIITLSYTLMFWLHPEIFSEVSGLEIIFILPQIIIYFAIYILGNVFFLFMLAQILYFIKFIIFLEKFYIRRLVYQKAHYRY